MIDNSYCLINAFMPDFSALRWAFVFVLFFAVCLVLFMDLQKKYRHVEPVRQIAACPSVLRWIVYYIMILSVMFAFVMTTNEYGQAGAFLYFQF